MCNHQKSRLVFASPRARRQAVHTLVQEDNDGGSDAGSESQGSEFHLDQIDLLRDEGLAISSLDFWIVGHASKKCCGDMTTPGSDSPDFCLLLTDNFHSEIHWSREMDIICRESPSTYPD